METQTNGNGVAKHEKPQLEYEESPTLGALFAALAKAQGEMRHAAKSNTNPHFRSRYASLADIREAVREPLAKHGLAVLQPISNATGGVVVTTILGHASGEWIRSRLFIPALKMDAQGLGSATTYGLRYSLKAMVGIADDEDDDGNAASEPQGRYAPQLPTNGSKTAPAEKSSRTAALKEKLSKPKNPHAEAVTALLDKAGLVIPEARFELVKEATGKTKPADLTEDDVGRVQQKLADLEVVG